jgi:hypothetical protein
LLGSLAVLSKEPAFVLVHLVLLGSFLLERHQISVAWDGKTRSNRYLAITVYAILLGVTAWVALVSPTKANRFFPLATPGFQNLVRERIMYYSAIYLSVTARILLFTPMVYAFIRTVFERKMKMSSAARFSFFSFFAIVLALLCFQNILISIALVTFIFLSLATIPSAEQGSVRRLLPFVACLVIASGALLFTIQLVKTQLTEAALLSSILASLAWCVWGGDFIRVIQPIRSKKAFISVTISGISLIGIALIIGIWPRIVREERLLREVRDVRQNANDAMLWSAMNLPPGSLLAVTDYNLYGIDGSGAITAKDDETKLAEQPTFAGGFVFDALAVLGRTDFRRTFLTDSVLLPRVLNAMRGEPDSYILLQSKLDFDLFHGLDDHNPLVSMHDSLVAQFSRGPYPCEIWMLRN